MITSINIKKKHRRRYFQSLLRCLIMAIIALFFIQSLLFGIHFWHTLSLSGWFRQIGLVFFIGVIASFLARLSRNLQFQSLLRCLIIVIIGLFFLESYILGNHFWSNLSLLGWLDQIGLAFLIAIIASDLASLSSKNGIKINRNSKK